ncbi:MAG: RusA family crossover junction endodeoxyribonuclease [Desulfitobacterium hafniense]|nr:RusA family crossover junction endodeoxyribonuclease [Desulfitobacterium hafniense]
MTFTIPGNPMGKQRARTLKTGHSYTPNETVNYETLVKMAYDQLPDKCYFEGQLKIIITAVFGIPKSTSKAKAKLMLEGKMRPTKKPDWDNIGKIICDSLNGIAFHDDSQIVGGCVRKFYGEVPCVRVDLEEDCHEN